ncbi:MAG: divalent-cation tolerance protein CutA [Candidatus Thermoplasmatota archaeon]|jgi:periplasmic divalent cation tolerance protein|nr:divalent-cation tolerance protein CutA [Candidatus Thermoplasmatota archaeon]
MVVVVYSTIDDINQAKKISKTLVEEKLVACVNIIPNIHSIYRWKGRIEVSNECVIIAKTKDDNTKKVIQKIKSLHTYDLPDIIVLPLIDGLKEYLEYIENETL